MKIIGGVQTNRDVVMLNEIRETFIFSKFLIYETYKSNLFWMDGFLIQID